MSHDICSNVKLVACCLYSYDFMHCAFIYVCQDVQFDICIKQCAMGYTLKNNSFTKEQLN